MEQNTKTDNFYRRFLLDHIEERFNVEDIYDVVISLNPANKKYKIESNAELYKDNSYKVNLKLMYNFRTNSSANLFCSIYKNLVQRNDSTFKIIKKDNKVMIAFRDPMLVSHKIKSDELSKKQIERIALAVAFREETHLISDIMIKTIDSIINSGIYNMGEKKEDVLETTKEKFLLYEKMLPQFKNKTDLDLYKNIMNKNSIKVNNSINKSIVEQIESAIESRIDSFNGLLLIKNMSILSNNNGGLKYAMNTTSKISKLLENKTTITPVNIREKNFFSKIINKISIKDNNIQEPAKYKLRYK